MRLLLTLIIVGLLSYGYSKRTRPIGSPSTVKFSTKLSHTYYKELFTLNQDQIYWLTKVYRVCESYDLQYTCMAIAWEESKFNKWGDNEAGDYGLMGINLYWYMIDNHLNYHNKYRRIEARTKLVRDSDYNLAYALQKLLKLREKYKDDYKKIWSCYNGGTLPNYYYGKRIYNRIIALRKWIKKTGIILY